MNTSVVTPRHSKKERRYKLAKFHHLRKIPRAFAGEQIFFDRENDSNIRVSNVESMGTVSAYKSYLLKRIQFRPALGTSEADLVQLMQHCIVELKIGGDEKAIQLPFQDVPPAAGLGPNSGIPMIGSPEPRGGFDVGIIRVAGQVQWNMRLRTPGGKTLYFAEDLYLDAMIELLLDEPKG